MSEKILAHSEGRAPEDSPPQAPTLGSAGARPIGRGAVGARAGPGVAAQIRPPLIEMICPVM